MILSSKLKKEKLIKFIEKYKIRSTDLSDAIIELLDKEMDEIKNSLEEEEEEGDVLDLECDSNSDMICKDYAGNPDSIWEDVRVFDVPNVNIQECKLLNELIMLKNSGLLEEEEIEEFSTLKENVERDLDAFKKWKQKGTSN